MQRLLFHIGLPKTGSSALQVFFAQNRDAMLPHSVDYLPIGAYAAGAEGRISSGNAGMLARNLAGKNGDAASPQVRGARAEFLQALRDSPAQTGLVSSETLGTIRPHRFADLIKEVEAMGIRTELMYFIREQEQALCSGYMQQVKRHGCIEGPEDYIEAAYAAPGSRLNYDALYDRMQELFEPAAIHCMIYEEARLAKGGLFGAFVGKVGIPMEGLDFTTKDVNNSLHPSEISVMLVLNRYAPRGGFSDVVVENGRDTGRTRSGSTHRLISSALSHRIKEFYANSNKTFAQRYFQRDMLFPPRQIEDGEGIDADNVDPIALAQIFGGLLVKYDQRLAALERRIGNPNRRRQERMDELDSDSAE